MLVILTSRKWTVSPLQKARMGFTAFWAATNCHANWGTLAGSVCSHNNNNNQITFFKKQPTGKQKYGRRKQEMKTEPSHPWANHKTTKKYMQTHRRHVGTEVNKTLFFFFPPGTISVSQALRKWRTPVWLDATYHSITGRHKRADQASRLHATLSVAGSLMAGKNGGEKKKDLLRKIITPLCGALRPRETMMQREWEKCQHVLCSRVASSDRERETERAGGGRSERKR